MPVFAIRGSMCAAHAALHRAALYLLALVAGGK
jgi:hypothetical protein